MPSLKIRVGASVDASVPAAFTSIEKLAQRTGAVVAQQLGGRVTTAMRSAAASANSAAAPVRAVGAAAATAARQGAAAGASLGAAGKAAKTAFEGLQSTVRRLPADLASVTREAQRALQAMERDKARAALGLSSGARHSRYAFAFGGKLAIHKPELETLRMDPIGGIARYGMAAASYLRRAAGTYVHSLGVETDAGAYMARNVGDETRAQQISNAGYMPGQGGANSMLVDRERLLGQTRDVGIGTGTERGELLQGLQKFVGLTGDLALGRNMLKDMAVLARATGSDFTEMAAASAEVSNHLGDVPDKGAATLAIMRQITGEGKLGAIEVRDLARQMAKLASHANQFKGGTAENIATLGLVAQEAKLRGGATNAAQATTAVVRFTEELTKSSVQKHLGKAGIDVFTDKSNTQLKSFDDIVKSMLHWSRGDLKKLDQIMPSSIGKKALGGFAAIYNETSGTDAQKIAAVTDEFQRLRDAQLTQDEVIRAFNASMTTSEAKAKVFNERMAALAEQVQGALLPAFERLAPKVVEATQALAEMFTEKPGGGDSLFGGLIKMITGGGVESAQAEASRQGTKLGIEGDNAYRTMRRWEMANLVTNAEGPYDAAANMRAAAPILEVTGEKEKALRGTIDPLAKRVAEEAKAFEIGGHPASLKTIQRYATGEGTDRGTQEAAQAYLADKQTLDGLMKTMSGLHEERERLIQVLQSGAVTVRLAPGSPQPNRGGTTPAEAP